MTTSGTVPSFQIPAPQVRKSSALYWLFGTGGVLALIILWQCGGAFWRGHKLSNDAVARFHDQWNRGDYEDLIAESDDAFRAADTDEKLVSFLTSLHAKLGDAGESSLTNINISTSTKGTFLTTIYSTSFTTGEAAETFTWIKKNGAIKLYRYNVNSAALK